MHDKIHVIQQDPLGLVVPFRVGRTQASLCESLLYLIRDGLNLPRVATRADDKIVGKAAVRLVEFERGNVSRLLLFAGGYGGGDLVLEVGLGGFRFGHRPSVSFRRRYW